MYFITLMFVIMFVTFHGMKCDCDENTGPVGSYECVLLDPQYYQYQWAHCRTKKYLELKFKGRYYCETPYCYVQCNIEVYDDIVSREVLPNCLCDPGFVPLPGNCTRPDGTDCNWYIDCLEKRYPCKESGETSYATDYGLKYCNLYTDHYQWFSDTGKKWIDAVRICLQKHLAPVLNHTSGETCQGIQDKAIASHHGCYFNAGDDSPSFCDISFADWAKVFWTIKGGFTEKATAWPMLNSTLHLPQECHWKVAEYAVRGVSIFTIGMSSFAEHIIGKRSLDHSIVIDYDRAFEISELFASQMKWNESGIAWFAYPADGVSMSITLMLASKADYDLNADPTTVSVNMTESVSEFEYSLKNGEISIPIDGFHITSISTCHDISCSSIGPELEINFSKPQSSRSPTLVPASITTLSPCNDTVCISTSHAQDFNQTETESSGILTSDSPTTTTVSPCNDTVCNSTNQNETESSDILTSDKPYENDTISTVSPCNGISCSSTKRDSKTNATEAVTSGFSKSVYTSYAFSILIACESVYLVIT